MVSEPQKKFVFYTKNIEFKSRYDEKAKKTRFFIKGHIDTEELDLVNDIVTKSCMADIQMQLKKRNIKLDLDHETLRKGKDGSEFDAKLNLTKLPLGKAINETLDKKGNLVEFELNSNWKKLDSKGNVVTSFAEVWDNIKSGFYDALSIAYVPLKTAYRTLKFGKARLLDRINLINVALTGNPINPGATISSVMAKSLEYLKENEEHPMQNKGFDKDGAHAHTEEAPLGEHNHPEIETRLRSEVDYLNDRISRLFDRVIDLENNKPVSETAPGLKTKQKTKSGDKKMTDEETAKPDGEATPQDQTTEPQADDSAKTEPAEPQAGEKPAEGNDAGAEEKSIDAKAFGELKSNVDKLAKSVDKINELLEKALPAGYGAESKAQTDQTPVDTKSHSTGTLDLI